MNDKTFFNLQSPIPPIYLKPTQIPKAINLA